MKSFSVSTNKGILFFCIDDVVRLQASSNYTYIHFANHKKILSTKVLHNFEEELLPAGFIRIHNSHLINKQYIKKIDNAGIVYLNDNTTINIARRRRKEVMEQLKKIILDNTIAA